jgi:hypothetical protein
MQVIHWEDGGGYAAVHPALAWPTGTDPYHGLDDERRWRWRRFDAAEASLSANEEFAILPASLVEPGDHVLLHVGGNRRVVEVNRLQSVPGDEPGR